MRNQYLIFLVLIILLIGSFHVGEARRQLVRCGRFTRSSKTLKPSQPAWFKANKNTWTCKARLKMHSSCSSLSVTCGPPGLSQYINCRQGDKFFIIRTNAGGNPISNSFCEYERPIKSQSRGQVILRFTGNSRSSRAQCKVQCN